MTCGRRVFALALALGLLTGPGSGNAQDPYYPDYYPTPAYSPGLRPFYPGYNYYNYGTYYVPSYNPIYTGYDPGVYTSQDRLRYFTVRRDIAYVRPGGAGYAAVPAAPGTATVYAIVAPSDNARGVVTAGYNGEDAEQRAAAADITVGVPASAEVWFEGQKMKQAGILRRFQSPALAPGRDYQYDVRARWKEGEREIDRTRQVLVRAGAHVDVDFTVPAAEGKPEKVPAPEATGAGKDK